MPHLAQAGIETYFRVVIGGDDLPVKKPHPGALLHAARELGVEPAKLLMVGDSGNDAQAARAAGCPVLCPLRVQRGDAVRISTLMV